MAIPTALQTNDPLSAALMRMKLQAFVNVTLEAGGDWAIDFAGLDGLILNVVQKGTCWLSIEGHLTDIQLNAGDCYLMTGGKKFTLATDVSLKKHIHVEQLFEHMEGGVLRYQGGGDFVAVGTLFRFEGHLARTLFGRLPPVIHIPGNSEHADVLRWSLECFNAELRGSGVGHTLMLNHLAPIMLLQTLRSYLLSATREKNWLVALSNPKLSKVFDAMHTDFKRDWSLEALAELANLSRSGLALSFKKMVGVAPMDYLTQWRMQVACELLQTTNESVASIANAVGYNSESGFSLKFSKTVKCRPGAYRKRSAPAT